MKAVTRLLFLCFLFLGSLVFSTPAPQVSSETITVRRAPAEKIQKYLSDKDFKYEDDYKESVSLWDRFMRWLSRFLFKPLFKNHSFSVSDAIIYAIAIAALILIVYFLLKSEKVGLFYRKRGGETLHISDTEEDINQMDFAKLIEKAIANGQYRIAIRYLYLRLLKDLSDRQLIIWRAEKTNWDYSNEMRPSQYSKQFNQATFLFDYAWYGDVPINETTFKGIKESFEQFNNQLHRPN